MKITAAWVQRTEHLETPEHKQEALAQSEYLGGKSREEVYITVVCLLHTQLLQQTAAQACHSYTCARKCSPGDLAVTTATVSHALAVARSVQKKICYLQTAWMEVLIGLGKQ